jgi:hypothetical protein
MTATNPSTWTTAAVTPRSAPPSPGIQTVPITDSAICLDTTRIYREAYEQSGIADGLLSEAEAGAQADAEFSEEAGGRLR